MIPLSKCEQQRNAVMKIWAGRGGSSEPGRLTQSLRAETHKPSYSPKPPPSHPQIGLASVLVVFRNGIKASPFRICVAQMQTPHIPFFNWTCYSYKHFLFQQYSIQHAQSVFFYTAINMSGRIMLLIALNALSVIAAPIPTTTHGALGISATIDNKAMVIRSISPQNSQTQSLVFLEMPRQEPYQMINSSGYKESAEGTGSGEL
jgi:hypothetical protein